MIKRTIIFGSEAVSEFQNTGVVPSGEWLNEHDGHIEEISFKSIEGYNAYMKALADYDGWNKYDCVEDKPVIKPTLQFRTLDNPEWRNFPNLPTVNNFNIDFLVEFMHNYYSSDEVACEDDMQKFIDDEITLDEFEKYNHGIKSKEEAHEEMKRLRQIILNETIEDFFSDLATGKIEFRRVQII